MTTLYCYIKQGTAFDVASLVPRHARRHNTLTVPELNGDTIAVVWAYSYEARQMIEKNGILVAPAMHRPLATEHVAAFSHAGAKQGDTTYDLALKLYAHHGMFWFHPEFNP